MDLKRSQRNSDHENPAHQKLERLPEEKCLELDLHQPEPRQWNDDPQQRVGELTSLHVAAYSQTQSESAPRGRDDFHFRMTQLAVDLTEDAIFWIDDTGGIAFGNDSACHLLQYDRKSLLTRSIFDVDTSQSCEHWPLYCEQLRAVKRLQIETEIRKRDGQLFPAQVTTHIHFFEVKWTPFFGPRGGLA
jgi:PAS domain S-box-containing protein